MTHKTEIDIPADEAVIRMRRRFDAPPELVYEAFTRPELLRRWWLGPPGMVMIECRIDLRVGGTWRMVQQDPEGNIYPFRGEYLELDPPKRIRQTFIFDMEGVPDTPAIETLTLSPTETGTLLETVSRFETMELRNGMAQSGMEDGTNASFERLVGVLDDERDGNTLSLNRVFDAPPDLVYDLWTRREHVNRWMMPDGFTIVEADADLRPGGAWHTHMRHPEHGFFRIHGEYREIVPGQKLVFTHFWMNDDGSTTPETLVTVTFEKAAGRTLVTLTQTGFADTAARDGHRGGWAETLDALTAYMEEKMLHGERA